MTARLAALSCFSSFSSFFLLLFLLFLPTFHRRAIGWPGRDRPRPAFARPVPLAHPQWQPTISAGHRKRHACPGSTLFATYRKFKTAKPKICTGRRAGWPKKETFDGPITLFVRFGPKRGRSPPAQAPLYFCTIRTRRSPPPMAAHNSEGIEKGTLALGRLCSRLTGNLKPRNPRYAQVAGLGGPKKNIRWPNHSVCSLGAKTRTLPRLRRRHFTSARYGRGDRRKRRRSRRSGHDHSQLHQRPPNLA